MSKRAYPHMVTITTRIPRVDKEAFMDRAIARGISMSRLICIAMKREISPSVHEQRILRCLSKKGYHETGDC